MDLGPHINRHGSQIIRFLFVGGIGFVVDAVALLLMVSWAGMSPVWSRIPSLLIALTTTWWLHRSFTFAWAKNSVASSHEWLRFVIANAVGNGLNLCLYWVLIGLLAWGILLSLTVASIAAAGINYALSARWVFRRN
jgi:putative flippase GtrA